jgi:hypothetical protein
MSVAAGAPPGEHGYVAFARFSPGFSPSPSRLWPALLRQLAIPRDSPSGLRFVAKLIKLRLKERISEPFLRQVEVGVMPKRISDLCVTVEGAGPREVTGLSKDARTPLMALVEWALRHGRIVIPLCGGFLLGDFLGQEAQASGEISPCVLKKPRRR